MSVSDIALPNCQKEGKLTLDEASSLAQESAPCPVCSPAPRMGAASLLHSPVRDPTGCGLLCTPSPSPPGTPNVRKPLLLASHLDHSGVGQAHCHRALLWPGFPLFSPHHASSALGLVSHGPSGRFDLHRLHRRRAGCGTCRPSCSHPLAPLAFSLLARGL